MSYKLFTHIVILNSTAPPRDRDSMLVVVDTKMVETEHGSMAEVEAAQAAFKETYRTMSSFSTVNVKFTVVEVKAKDDEVVPLMRIGNLLFDPSLVASASRYAHADESLKGLYVYLLGENRDNGGHFVKMDTDEQIQEALDKIHKARINGVLVG